MKFDITMWKNWKSYFVKCWKWDDSRQAQRSKYRILKKLQLLHIVGTSHSDIWQILICKYPLQAEWPVAQRCQTDKIKKSNFSSTGSGCQRRKAYLKNSTKEKPYPCCSAMPAHTTLADAPINVPFPESTIKKINKKSKVRLTYFSLLTSILCSISITSWKNSKHESFHSKVKRQSKKTRRASLRLRFY